MNTAEKINSQRLMAETGATYRQIDHWRRTGRLIAYPRIRDDSGHFCTFPESEIAVARLLITLSNLDMNGSTGGSGRGKRSTYLAPLIAHVRENGLHGDWDIGEHLTLHLDAMRPQ